MPPSVGSRNWDAIVYEVRCCAAVQSAMRCRFAINSFCLSTAGALGLIIQYAVYYKLTRCISCAIDVDSYVSYCALGHSEPR